MKTLVDLIRLWEVASIGNVVVTVSKELNGFATYTARAMDDHGILVVPDGIKIVSCYCVDSKPRVLFQIIE